MYSARCRRPWGTSHTDQDLAKLRRKRESYRKQREERGEQDYSCPSYEWGSEIIPVPAMGRAGGGGRGRAMCALQLIHPPPPPPSRATGMTSGSNPPQAGKGEGGEVRGEEGGEEVTWTTATSQLLERPLGGWTGNTVPT